PVAGDGAGAHPDPAPAARPRPGLGRGHAGQLDRAAAPKREQPRRPARARLQHAAARRPLAVLAAVPGQPDQRRPPLLRARARRRHHARGPHRPLPDRPALMDLVLRTVYVFFLILVVTRAVGRRELSSMEPFDLILLVVIGDLV